jgi:transposase
VKDGKLSVMEAAQKYKVSSASIYRWIKKGLPVTRKREIGRMAYIVIDADELEKFLAEWADVN